MLPRDSVFLPLCEMKVSKLRIRWCTGEYGSEDMMQKTGRVGTRRASILLISSLKVPGYYDTSLYFPPEQRHVHQGLRLAYGPRCPVYQPAPGPVIALHVRLHRLHSRVHHVGWYQLPGQLQATNTHSHLFTEVEGRACSLVARARIRSRITYVTLTIMVL